MPTRKRLQDRGYHGVVVTEGTYANLETIQRAYNIPSMSATVARILADLEVARAEIEKLKAAPAGVEPEYFLAVLKTCGAEDTFIAKVKKRL